MVIKLKMTWFSNPITKKNSINMVDLGKQCPCCKRRAKTIPLPSKAFKEYEKAVKAQLQFVAYQMFDTPITVKCLYYMATNRSVDLTNLIAATHDILQHCGVIADDKLVVSVDGSRIVGKDPEPRCEITITEFKGEI